MAAVLDNEPLTAPTLADIEARASVVMASLPPELAVYTRNLVVQIEEFPEADVQQELGLESPYELLGLYRGTDLPEKSLAQPLTEPDLIFLYRRPLLDYWCETGEDLADIIRHVVIHEVGHHFGFSDDEMSALENAD